MCLEDHSVPCSQSTTAPCPPSPAASLVPTTNKSTPAQQLKEKSQVPERGNVTSNEDIVLLSASSSTAHQLINDVNGEGKLNYYFPIISQDQSYGLSEEDSCDASYLQSISNSAVVFNQQYHDKREQDESLTAANSFSPDAFFSSVPLFKKLRKKKPAARLPKLSITDPSTGSQYEQSDQCSSYLTSTHGGLILPKPNFTVLLHDSNQGVPIAPRPDPNSSVSCYVLVVPAPLYYENFLVQESLQLQPLGQAEDMQPAVPPETQEKIIEIDTTPEGKDKYYADQLDLNDS